MAEFELETLKKKYRGFTIPEFKIKVNEKVITDVDEIFIDEVKVELTAGFEASACSFHIAQGITFQNKKVENIIDEHIKLGNEVEVSLGYADKVELVFKGIVFSMELEYSQEENFSFQIECMDVKGLMMNNFRSQLKKDMKKFSEAVHAVLKKYTKWIDKQTVDATKEVSLPIEQQGQSDYEFIVSLAKKIHYAFYIVRGEVFFQPIGKNTLSMLTLTLGEFVYRFNREISLSGQISSVTVKSNDEKDPNEPIEATATTYNVVGNGKKGAKDLTKIISEDMKKTIIDPSVASQEQAEERAKAELTKQSMKFATGELESIGIPEIIPGRMMTIKGFGNGFDNDYYVLKATHEVNKNGYITKCTIGVNQV